MCPTVVSNPRQLGAQEEAEVGAGESIETVLLCFDDLVVDGSLGPVVVKVLPNKVAHKFLEGKDDLLIELQCEV